MTGAMGLLMRCAFLVAASRAEQIKIVLDYLINPRVDDSKPWGLSYFEVSDEITAADLVERANFFGKVYDDDWDWQRWVTKTMWSADPGNLLIDAYRETVQGPWSNLFVAAHYGGQMMKPTSTLRSNGVKEMSTVLLRRAKDAGETIMASKRVFTKITYNGKNEWLYMYRREDLWNLFNVFTHRYGAKVDDSEFDVPTMGKLTPKVANPTEYDFKTLGKIKDDTGKNPIEITIGRTKKCKCMGSSKYATVSGEMTKRLAASKYGLGCAAHDASTKTCGKKSIEKGNRKCWCPRKWCYVEDGCGSPSVKFPGLSFSYDICANTDQVDCFALDTEGVEEAMLDDFEMWTFPKVSGYLQKLATVLVDAFPSLEKKFGLDD